MISRNIDKDGKIITSGKHFCSGKESVGVQVERRLGMFRGEYIFDRTIGLNAFLVFGNQMEYIVMQEIRRVIESSPDVERVIEPSLTKDDRTLKYTCKLQTSEGEIIDYDQRY